MAILELKNIADEVVTSEDGLKSRMEVTLERSSILEERSTEIIQPKKERKKIWQ